MRYADLLARITGLCVAVAGATLAGLGLLVGPAGGVQPLDAVTLDTLAAPKIAAAVVGAAFVIAGLAVLVGRGRAFAVSVGGVVAAVAVASLAVGVASSAGLLAVGAVALALLFAGASTGRQAAG